LKLVDLHVHTPYCGHASGSAEATIQSAIKNRFDLLGFSEHYPYPDNYPEPIPDCVVPANRWPEYMNEMKRLQTVYGDQLEIRIGAEVDYLPDYEKEIKQSISGEKLDYVYGSMHLINNIGIDYKEEYLKNHMDALGGVDGMWEKYWLGLERLIRMKVCDIIAHMDLPKKLKSGQPVKDQTDGFRPILEMIKKFGLVLEINTGGIDRAYKREPYPSRQILQHAAELGIEMTIGSDAHAPDQVGRYFDKAVQLLKLYGWKEIVVFRNRKKQHISLYE